MKVVLQKDDFVKLESLGYFKDATMVNDVWSKLVERCPPPSLKDIEEASQQSQTSWSYRISFPSLNGKLKSDPTSNTISIAYSSRNGSEFAITIKSLIEKVSRKQGITVNVTLLDGNSPDFSHIESCVAGSSGLIVILSADALKQPEVVFPMICAKHYFIQPSQVILVHAAETCWFPGTEEQPEEVQEFFSDKAITFLSCYEKSASKQILEKWKLEKEAIANDLKNKSETATAIFNDLKTQATSAEGSITTEQFEKMLLSLDSTLQASQVKELVQQADSNKDGKIEVTEFVELMTTTKRLAGLAEKYQTGEKTSTQVENFTVFLSHKRSTGQGIAGRLYEGLKEDYKTFLDSEAKFKLNDLQSIVKNTKVVIFLLTHGILQSVWCREELKSAMENKKKIILVRDLAYSLPQPLPQEWQSSLGVLLQGKKDADLVWMAEYNTQCIRHLKKLIGPSDKLLEDTKQFLSSSEFLKKLKEGEWSFMPDPAMAKCIYGLYPNLPLAQKANFSTQPDRKIFKFLAGLQYLKLWNIEMKQKDFDHMITKMGANLETLYISGNLGASFASVAKTCLKLKSLNLNSCKLKDAAFLDLAASQSLQQLDISGNISDQSLINLATGAPNLTDLILYCSALTHEGVGAFLASHPNIQRLVLQYTATAPALSTFIGKCHDLKRLSLSGTKIDDRGLREILEGCPKIQSLSLISWSAITDSGVEEIPAKLADLQELDLSFLKRLTENSLKAIGTGCKKLISFSLYESSIGNTGLEFLSQCQSLQSLSLNNLSNITDEGMKILFQNCPNLCQLRLWALPLTNTTLHMLAESHLKITSLVMHKIKLTDEGLSSVSKLAELQSLTLWSLENITGEGFVELKNCKQLKEVQIEDCYGIRQEHKMQLQQHLPALKWKN